MLQRSPSYIISLPAVDPVARALGWALPTRYTYPLVRWKNVLLALGIYGLSRRRPAAMKRVIRKSLERRLPAGYDIDTHFKPSYEPWDQRMCIVPDGDFFDAIAAGRVSVVTDRIEGFTDTGIALESGSVLEADMVVTATGLDLVPIGGIRLSVDGDDVDVGQALTYRGMMLSGVPNMAFSFGYTNQSWTLGSDLTARQICRLLSHMDRYGHTQCTPRTHDPAVTPVQFVDLSSGYIRRAMDRFPKQGSKDPWRRQQSYTQNSRAFRRPIVDDPELEFSRAPGSARGVARPYLSAAPASRSPAP
jgi:cation diffusion facilitator CzcD-associated flavoprotein CzcO